MLKKEKPNKTWLINVIPHIIETIDCEFYIMQIFRSIDSNSVKRFPKEPRDASIKVNEKNFLCLA